MQGLQSLLVALVASLALVSTTAPSLALASQVDVPYHHVARGHNSVRSVVLDHGKKLKAKRATQAQQEAAARAKVWSENFAKQNTAWQAAANEDLKNGKTPQDFDTWAASNGGRDGNGNDSPDGSSSKSSNDNQDSQSDDSDDDDDDDSASSSSSASTASKQTPSSSSSSASSSATAAAKQKQAYKEDNASSSSKSSSQASSKSSSSSSSSSTSSSSGSGLLAGISNIVTGGQATYYNTGLGACGWTNSDSDYIVALPVGVWNRIGGTVSNGNIVCGKKLKVSNGKTSIEVEITDQCPSCDDKHLDLSPAAFKSLGDEAQGVLPISWGWVDGEPSK